MTKIITQETFATEHNRLTLRGSVYRPAGDGRHPCVVFLHGFTGTRVEAGFLFVRLARTLAQQGIAVVTFDFMHSGESDGSFEQMLVTGQLADAIHVFKWAQGRPFIDRSRVGVLGFSLGGLVAACLMRREPQCKTAVLLAPTTVNNLCRHATKSSPHGEKGQVVLGPNVLHARFFEDLRTLDPVGDLTASPRPTLIVQGTGDQAVPPAVSQEYADALHTRGTPATYHTIDGADHIFASPTWHKQLFTAVSQWFTQQL